MDKNSYQRHLEPLSLRMGAVESVIVASHASLSRFGSHVAKFLQYRTSSSLPRVDLAIRSCIFFLNMPEYVSKAEWRRDAVIV